MKLYEIVSAEEILDAAFQLPTMKIKPRSAKRPTEEMAMKAALLETEAAVVRVISQQVHDVLADEYESFCMINGTWEEAEDKDEWEDQADKLVDEAIKPWYPYLSQSWLGENTIATSLHLEDGLNKFCVSLGTEYFKQVTHDNKERRQASPAKILSAAGITKDDVLTRLERHNNPTNEEIETMTEQQSADLDSVLQKIAAHLGKDYDANAVYNDLDLATDDDEILAAGAAPRLGLDESDIPTLQAERMIHGTDAIDIIMQGVQAVLDGGTEKKGKGKKAKKEAAPKPAATEAKAVPAPLPPPTPAQVASYDNEEGNLDSAILLALKECGAVDAEMAKGMGVSRATYNNYANGKTSLSPNETQYNFLRSELVDRANKLAEALAALDGTEPQVVY